MESLLLTEYGVLIVLICVPGMLPVVGQNTSGTRTSTFKCTYEEESTGFCTLQPNSGWSVKTTGEVDISGDHTTNTTEGHVAVVESDLDSVLRISPLRIVDNAVVSVHYYMHSNSIKPPYPFLNVSVLCEPPDSDLGKPETLTSYEGSSWRRWAEARLYVSADSGCKVFTVLIKGRRGDGTLAIDDVELRTDDPAPSRLLATSAAVDDVTSYTVEPLPEPQDGAVVTSCFFNNSDDPFCGWENPHHGNLAWTRRKGQTPTPNTGPMDARPDGDLYYVHIEATTVMNEDHDNFTASLYTPEITQTDAKYMCAKFYYHMYGKDIGTFSVFIQYGMDMLTRRLLYELGEKDQHWYRASVTFAATFQPFRLLFEATAYPGRQLGDIALDDVIIMTGRCPKETEPTEAPTSGGAQNHFLQPTRTETIIIAAILGGIVVVLLVAVIALGAPLLIKSFKRSRCFNRRRRGGRQQGNTPMARTQSQSPFSRDELWGTYFSRRFRNRPPSYRTYQRHVAAEQQLRRINAATLAPPTEGEPPPAYDDVFNSAYNQLDDPPEAEVMTTLEPVPEEGITPDNPVENEGEENENPDETLDKLEERLQKKPKRRRAVDKDTFTVDIETTNDEEEVEEDDQNDSSVQSNTEDTEDTQVDVENEDTESQVNQTEVQIQTEPVIEESRNTSGDNCQSSDDVRIVIRLPSVCPQPADDSDGGITNAAFEGDNEEEPAYEEIRVPDREEARSC